MDWEKIRSDLRDGGRPIIGQIMCDYRGSWSNLVDLLYDYLDEFNNLSLVIDSNGISLDFLKMVHGNKGITDDIALTWINTRISNVDIFTPVEEDRFFNALARPDPNILEGRFIAYVDRVRETSPHQKDDFKAFVNEVSEKFFDDYFAIWVARLKMIRN